MFTLHFFAVLGRHPGGRLAGFYGNPFRRNVCAPSTRGRYPHYEILARSQLATVYNNESVWMVPSTVDADD
jgi:hypothetical protein